MWIKKAEKSSEKEFNVALKSLINSTLEEFIEVGYDGDMDYFFETNPKVYEAIWGWVKSNSSSLYFDKEVEERLMEWYEENK